MATARKTRSHKSTKSHALYDLLGSGSEITHSELPTLRQCLRYGLFLRERSLEDLDVREMCVSVFKEVKSIWDKVNPEICIIGPKSACDKLVKEWENAKSCAQKREWLHQFLKNSLKDWINCLILQNANVGFMSVLNNPVPAVNIRHICSVTAQGKKIFPQ